MSKIIIAVNQMISNAGKIQVLNKTGDTYFFKYDNKHNWSITCYHDPFDYEKQPEFMLTYYNQYVDIDEEIEKIGGRVLGLKTPKGLVTGTPESVHYSTKYFKTAEAYETFQELYQVIQEKNSGLENVLDEIIESI